MSSLPQLATALQQVLQLAPLTLEATTGFCQRRSKCTAALFVQTTVLGWAANPAATLAELAGVSAACGVTLSPQALEQRLRTPAAAQLLEQVLAHVVQQALPGLPTTLPLLQRFPAVLVLDSTTVRLPDALAPIWAGCGGSSPAHTQAAVKLSVRLDLVTGRLDGPALSPGREQDRATVGQHHAVPAGALRIADRGFWSLAVLQHIREDAGHFLSYLPVQTVLSDPDTRTRLELLSWLETQAEEQPDGRRCCDRPVLLGGRHHLPARLLAWQESPATRDGRAERLRAHARHKGRRAKARGAEAPRLALHRLQSARRAAPPRRGASAAGGALADRTPLQMLEIARRARLLAHRQSAAHSVRSARQSDWLRAPALAGLLRLATTGSLLHPCPRPDSRRRPGHRPRPGRSPALARPPRPTHPRPRPPPRRPKAAPSPRHLPTPRQCPQCSLA
mgnify:CR=1 FL=1